MYTRQKSISITFLKYSWVASPPVLLSDLVNAGAQQRLIWTLCHSHPYPLGQTISSSNPSPVRQSPPPPLPHQTISSPHPSPVRPSPCPFPPLRLSISSPDPSPVRLSPYPIPPLSDYLLTPSLPCQIISSPHPSPVRLSLPPTIIHGWPTEHLS